MEHNDYSAILMQLKSTFLNSKITHYRVKMLLQVQKQYQATMKTIILGKVLHQEGKTRIKFKKLVFLLVKDLTAFSTTFIDAKLPQLD